MIRPRLASWFSVVALLPTPAGAAPQPDAGWPIHRLEPDLIWQLNLPDLEPFEASALLLTPTGELLTVNNRGPEIFKVRLPDGSGAADLIMDRKAFAGSQLRLVAPTPLGRYDCEGLARDHLNRLYLCEESQRWILRWDPRTDQTERLNIDWSPVQSFFSKSNRNASFEGVAVGGDRLYVANERQQGRIIVVDLDSLTVLGSFEVRTHRKLPWDTHYSDLSWHRDRLYVLCREGRAILRVDPATRAVEAEYDFASIELNPEWRYRTRVPLAGLMEGLAVDAQHIWLVTDNNDAPRVQDPQDRRPTLFRCPNPTTQTPPR